MGSKAATTLPSAIDGLKSGGLDYRKAYEILSPDKTYRLSESDPRGDIKATYIPSTLYLDVSIKGRTVTDGKGLAVGLRSPIINGAWDKFSIFFGKGSVGLGIPLSKTPVPYLGIGNINLSPTSGISMGWFPLTEAPDPWLTLAGSAIVLVQTIIEGCDNAGDCVLRFLSNLMIQATPINTLREIAQKIGIDTATKACDDIWEQSRMDRCFMYSTSYTAQGLFEVAHDMVSHGIEGVKKDPYVRAALLSEHDRIRFDEQGGGIPYGTGKEIALNITTTMDEVEGFLNEHESWLTTGEGERPSDEDLTYFMGGSLYLLRKLQTYADVDGERLHIKGGAPISFHRASDMVRFIEVASKAYNSIASSRLLWGNITGRVRWHADALTDEIDARCPEALINQWFLFKNLKSWIDEVSSPHLKMLFSVRKIHLIAKLRSGFKGERRDEYIQRMIDAKMVDMDVIDETMTDVMSHLSEIDENLTFLASAVHLYSDLELLLRLSYEEDPMAEMVGLDLTNLIKTPPMYRGFEILYHLEVAQKNGAADYADALEGQARTLLQRVVKYHSSDIAREIKRYRKRLGRRIGKIEGNIGDIADLFEDTPFHEEAIKKSEAYFESFKALARRRPKKGADHMLALMVLNEELQKNYDRFMIDIHDMFERKCAMAAEDEALESEELKEWSEELGELMGEFNNNFYDFISFKAGMVTMKQFMMETRGKI